MKPVRLKLYNPSDQSQAVEQVMGLNIDPSCTRCSLHQSQKRVCMAPEGRPGGLLVVSEYPSVQEAQAGRAFSGTGGMLLRRLVKKYWGDKPVVFDNALKCAPGTKKFKPEWVASCRPYLAKIIQEVKPSRILALGSQAIAGLTGRTPNALSVRSGWSWLSDGTPIFFSVTPLTASRNRFIAEWFEEDLRRALQGPIPPARNWQLDAQVVTTVDDAVEAYFSACEAPWVAFDVETVGEMFLTPLQILAATVTRADTLESWVWDREACQDERARPLAHILEDLTIGIGGQNIKFDVKAAYLALPRFEGRPVLTRHVVVDARLQRKLIASEAPKADLATLQELVGLGGGKDEAHAYVKAEKRKLQNAAAAARKKAGLKAAQVNPATVTRVLDRVTPEDAVSMRKGLEPGAYAFGAVPDQILMRYNAQDTVATCLISEQLKMEPSDAFVWRELLMPASEAFAMIEIWGMPIDLQRVHAFASYLEDRLDTLLIDIQVLAGDPSFQPGSWQQVQKLVYTQLKCEPTSFTDAGQPATDADSLLQVAAKTSNLTAQEVIEKIISWRRYDKLHGTYALGLLNHVGSDGRVHTTYNLDGARSGRLSSKDPNLQNIPRPESVEGKMARDLFAVGDAQQLLRPMAEHYGVDIDSLVSMLNAFSPDDPITLDDELVLVQADYSQLELRVAADLSGDPKMRQIFIDGDDYHLRTAQLVSQRAWGIPPNAVTKKHRSAAKIINFRTLYGGGDEANAKEIGCSVAEARLIREAIFGEFKELAKWINTCLRTARSTGYTHTSWRGKQARRRSLLDIGDQVASKRVVAEHGSWNTPVQGTASDFCLASVVACVQWLLASKFPAQLVGTVHDSIMFLTFRKTAKILITEVRKIMEGWETSSDVPIVADFEFGPSWGSLVPVQSCDFCNSLIEPGNSYGAGTDPTGKLYPVCSKSDCTTAHQTAMRLKGFGNAQDQRP